MTGEGTKRKTISVGATSDLRSDHYLNSILLNFYNLEDQSKKERFHQMHYHGLRKQFLMAPGDLRA